MNIMVPTGQKEPGFSLSMVKYSSTLESLNFVGASSRGWRNFTGSLGHNLVYSHISTEGNMTLLP